MRLNANTKDWPFHNGYTKGSFGLGFALEVANSLRI